MIAVTQFSDTHFGLPGARSHGGFGYDTDLAFDRIRARAFEDADRPDLPSVPGLPDLIVITGDLADHGHPDEYVRAQQALAQLPVRANICPGNHDFAQPFAEGLAGAPLTQHRSMRLADWLFVFADSNFDGKVEVEDGSLADRPNRIEAIGGLGADELTWLHDTIGGSDAANVFVWVHHPPAMTGAFRNPSYDNEMTELLDAHHRVRGIGGGHVHTDVVAELVGRPVFVCPAFTVNFDLAAWTLLPPGYRTYEFHDDGRVSSTCHLVDDPHWPRHPLPAAVVAHLRGDLSWAELTAQLERLRTPRST